MIVGKAPGLGGKISPNPKLQAVYLDWKSMYMQDWLALDYTFLGGYAKIPMLDINGFDVYDLGVDVSPKDFIDKIQEVDANIMGLSGFLTLAFEPMKETIELLKETGLDGKVQVMIGGGPVDDQACLYTGADAWGKDAMEAVEIAKRWNAKTS